MNRVLEVLRVSTYLGLTSFGGPIAHLGYFHREYVEKKKWIDEDTMLELITISEATPGPFAINGATYIGYHKAKFLWSLFATLGVVLPSFIVILLVSLFLQAFSDNTTLQNALAGIGAGVPVLIFHALFKLSKKVKINLINGVLLVIAFVVSFFTNFSVVLLLILTAVFALIYTAIERRMQA